MPHQTLSLKLLLWVLEYTQILKVKVKYSIFSLKEIISSFSPLFLSY